MWRVELCAWCCLSPSGSLCSLNRRPPYYMHTTILCSTFVLAVKRLAGALVPTSSHCLDFPLVRFVTKAQWHGAVGANAFVQKYVMNIKQRTAKGWLKSSFLIQPSKHLHHRDSCQMYCINLAHIPPSSSNIYSYLCTFELTSLIK